MASRLAADPSTSLAERARQLYLRFMIIRKRTNVYTEYRANQTRNCIGLLCGCSPTSYRDAGHTDTLPRAQATAANGRATSAAKREPRGRRHSTRETLATLSRGNHRPARGDPKTISAGYAPTAFNYSRSARCRAGRRRRRRRRREHSQQQGNMPQGH